jgi:hypothetical protein
MSDEDGIVSLGVKTVSPTDCAPTAVQLSCISAGDATDRADVLAVEEPLEIRLGCEVALE